MKEGGRNLAFRGGVIALAVVLGVATWLLTGDDSAEPVAESERPVSVSELGEVADALAQPLYWAGPVPGTSLTLVESESGVQVRYEREGVDPEQALTVATYPLPDAARALAAFAQRPGAIVRQDAGGRRVVSNEEQPNSVYFAAEGAQVEVYDPSPRRALTLALSGRVQPVP